MENLSSVQDVFSLLHQEPTEWTLFPNLLVFAVAAFFGQLLIDYAFETFLDKGLVFNLQVRKIPSSGTPLQTLRFKDYAFISFNRVTSSLFAYHLLLFAWTSERVSWGWDTLSLWNTLGSYLLFFVLYDFLYHNFHRFLHLRSVYPWIHKHHHKQTAPFRGNADACNTHPIEYVTGEYLHLLVFCLIRCHVACIGMVLFSMGLLASLNHTRFDVKFSPPLINRIMEYTVIAHDKHHHFITANYSQYTMLWDKLLGTFRVSKKGR